MARNYTAEDHKRAFKIWCDSRNLTAVTRELECDWGTPKRWMQQDYACPFGCPWHGWVELSEERDRAHSAKILLLNQGNADPVAHDLAIRRAVTDLEAPRVEAVDALVRSDLERVGHLEFIYSKVMYDMTGLVTDWRHFRGAGPNAKLDEETEQRLKDVLRGGLHCVSLKDGVNMLKTLRAEIEAIVGNARAVAQSTQPAEEERLDRSDLRKLRHLAKTLSPEELRALTDENGDRAAAG
jgi:hypothetical protein